MRLSIASVLPFCALLTASCSDSENLCSGAACPDTGQPPSGSDASVRNPDDLGVPPGPDLAPPADLAINPAGPWPTDALTIYGSANGLGSPILDASPDDAQNIWAVAPDSLYVLRPGQKTFAKFTAADGLHIQPFTDPQGHPAVTNITAVAGGHASEAFVGYYGYESDNRLTDTEANEQLGQADKITLGADGKISVLKYYFRCDHGSSWCWENRSVRRMLFAHTGAAAGHLFIGFDHGVTHVFQDHFGDHIHVETWYHYPDGTITEKIGEQYGLFVMPNGDLLSGSAYGVGLQAWNADPPSWVNGSFKWAFTMFGPAEPYNGNLAHSLDVPADYREDQRGVGVTPDGTCWFASLTHGLTSWNPSSNDLNSIRSWSNVAGLPTSGLMDLAADLDGTIWLVTMDGQLLRLTPSTATVQSWPGVSNVQRVVLDATVVPRALYVSMGEGGMAVIRAK